MNNSQTADRWLKQSEYDLKASKDNKRLNPNVELFPSTTSI